MSLDSNYIKLYKDIQKPVQHRQILNHAEIHDFVDFVRLQLY